MRDVLQNRAPAEELHLIRGLLRARDALPETIVDDDPGTTLQPPKGSSEYKDSSDNRRFIRGLLFTRGGCPKDYDGCSGDPSKSVFPPRHLPLSLLVCSAPPLSLALSARFYGSPCFVTKYQCPGSEDIGGRRTKL